MTMMRIFGSRRLRIFVCILLAAVFCVVPFEHKMLEAQASVTAAMIVPVICGILTAMGITFGGRYLADSSLQQANGGWRANLSVSLWDLAVDLYENCIGLADDILYYCFPGGKVGFNTIIGIPTAIYSTIIKYIMNKYGNAEKLEDYINGSSLFHCSTIKVGDCYLSPLSGFDRDNASSYIGTSSFSFTHKNDSIFSGEFQFKSVSSKGVYTYANCVGYDGSLGYSCSSFTPDPSSCAFILLYDNIVAPSEDCPYGSFKLYVKSRYTNSSGEVCVCNSFVNSSGNIGYFKFESLSEYQTAVGETDVDSFNIVEIDDNLFNGGAANMPKYIYVEDNVEDYIGKTAADVASPAYSEISDSEVVNATARTVTWQGDRTLCPIDELEGSLPTAVIGHWVVTWDEASTLCDISCYAEDGTAVWTGEVATTLTWADVLAKLGDIAITGAVGVAGAFTLPDTTLDFEPLKIAGDTFSKKFPFCLPFDLYNAFKQFDTDVEGKAPVYELPFNFGEQFGTHYVTIDMTKFTPLAKIVKWTVYVSFMLSLVVVTKKVLGGGS